MLESYIESRLKAGVEKLGGKCLKFTTPGMRGAPDRIVLLPPGQVWFVETKAPRGYLDPIQKAYHRHLIALGFRVSVLWTIGQINFFLNDIHTLRISAPRH